MDEMMWRKEKKSELIEENEGEKNRSFNFNIISLVIDDLK